MITERDMMRGVDWEFQDVTGWFASEKLWDVRLGWDGAEFWTRGGVRVDAPDWFKAGLPACEIDGGLVIPGETNDRAAADAVNYGRFPANARFAIYDAPQFEGNHQHRLLQIQARLLATTKPPHVFVVENSRLESLKQMAERVREILQRGGEGLMLQHPKAPYLRQRTAKLLKLKWCPQEFLYE